MEPTAQPNIPLDEISFENTEVAFASKTDLDLRRAWVLFRVLGQRGLVSLSKPLTQLAFKLKLPIDPVIRETLFRQFVGGESIEACQKTIEALGEYGIGSILDYSAEGKASESSFDQTRDELIKMLDRSRQDENIPFAVFKPTGIGRSDLLTKASQWSPLSPSEDAEFSRFKARFEAICAHAAHVGTPVFVDAEESWLQPVVDRMTLEMMQRYNQQEAWVWNTLQMYRRDRLAYLEDLIQLAERDDFKLGFKLVRGAYMEKERAYAQKRGVQSPIQPSKKATDIAFNAAVDRCLDHLDRISFCCGSHNEESNYRLMTAMSVENIPRNDKRIWFAQLLGMSDHISYNLARSGYNVAKYVPYAPIRDLVPYLMRRAEENTSVAGQSGRELSLLSQEMKRRRLI